MHRRSCLLPDRCSPPPVNTNTWNGSMHTQSQNHLPVQPMNYLVEPLMGPLTNYQLMNWVLVRQPGKSSWHFFEKFGWECLNVGISFGRLLFLFFLWCQGLDEQFVKGFLAEPGKKWGVGVHCFTQSWKSGFSMFGKWKSLSTHAKSIKVFVRTSGNW